MKKILSFVLSCILLISCVYINATISFAADDVKKIEYVCSKETYVHSRGNTYTVVNTYDGRGDLTKTVRTTPRQTVSESFSYDSKGNQTGYIKQVDDDKRTYSYIYDESNRLSVENFSFSSQITGRTVYNYDENGSLLREDYTSTDGFNTRYDYTYDDQGTLVKKAYRDSTYNSYTVDYTNDNNGNPLIEIRKGIYGEDYNTTYKYDANGNITKINRANSDNEKETFTYSYTADGKVKKESFSDSFGLAYSNTYSYNADGLMTKKTYKDYSDYVETTTYTYSSGRLVKESVKKDSGFTSTITYKYDSNNNLTLKSYKDSRSNTSTTTYEYKKLSSPRYERGNLTFAFSNKASFNGGATKLSIAIRDKNAVDKSNRTDLCKSLKNGTDYSLSYANNTAPGKATVTVKFKGDYAKEKDIKFTYTIVDYQVKDIKASKYTTTGYTLTWTAVSGAKSYKIERYIDDSSWVQLSPVTTNSVVISDLKANTTAYYRITPLKSNGSALGRVSDTYKAVTLLQKPTASKVSTTSIDLLWTEVSGATSYKVEKSVDKKTWSEAATVSKNSAKVSKLEAGIKYYFRVTALNSKNKAITKASDVLDVYTLCSAPSTSVKSSVRRTATISVKDVKGAQRYVYYVSSDNNNFRRVANVNTNSYTVTWLTSGSKIYVKVQAVNADGRSSVYSKVASTTIK